MNILVVDDDDLALEMLRHTLVRAGYQVETAANGREALAILRQGRTRLVISDWEMPEMSGIELCRSDSRRRVRRLHLRDPADQPLRARRDRRRDVGRSRRLHRQAVSHGGTAGADSRRCCGCCRWRRARWSIFALARLAESRDPETGHHLERVQSYSRVLAQKLAAMPEMADEIDPEFIRLIFLTSPLHDIGKVGIPDACSASRAG